MLRLEDPAIREALDLVPLPILIIDGQYKVRFANQASRAAFRIDFSSYDDPRPGTFLQCSRRLQSSGGCGTSPFCPRCIIRNGVATAIEKGSSHGSAYLAVFEQARLARMRATFSRIQAGGDNLALLTFQRTDAVEDLGTTESIIPVCACCKGARAEDAQGDSSTLHFAEILGADFAHGICPACGEQFFEAETEEKTPRD